MLPTSENSVELMSGLNRPTTSLVKRFDSTIKWLFIWQLFSIISYCLLAATSTFSIITLWDKALPLTEKTSLILICSCVLLFLLGLIGFIWSAYQHRPSNLALAKHIENKHPELLDTLNCATEINQKTQRSAFETYVLQQAEIKTNNIDFHKSLGFNKHYKVFLTGVCLLSLVLLTQSLQLAPLQKAQFALSDKLLGVDTGLKVMPGNHEIAIHNDARITAQLLRGIPEPVLEFQEIATPSVQTGPVKQEKMWRSIKVTEDPNSKLFESTLYNISQTMRYRVKTPDFTSPWYQLSPYHPPEIDSIRWLITPPAYTQLPAFEQTGWSAIKAPETSWVTASISIKPVDSQILFVHGKEKHILPLKDNSASLKWKLPNNSKEHEKSNRRTVYFELEDSFQHRSKSPEINFDIIYDKKPIVEITKPNKDLSIGPIERLSIESYLADDYGLTKAQLMLSVNGLKHTISLPLNSSNTLQTGFLLNLQKLNVKIGDLLSYHVLVQDNKEPEPQSIRSEIFFIEIENKKENDSGSSSKGNSEDKKHIPLRQYIAKAKHIIRQAYTSLNSNERQQNLSSNELRQDALDLKQNIDQIYAENRRLFISVNGIDTAQLMLESTDELSRATDAFAEQKISSAIKHTETALRQLVSLYHLTKQDPPSSTGGTSKQSEKNNTSETQKQQTQQSLAKKLTLITEALATLQQLKQQQKSQNSTVKTAQQRNTTQLEKLSALAEAQLNTLKLSQDLHNEIYRSTGKIKLSQAIKLASEAMNSSEHALRSSNIQQAHDHGIRAYESLKTGELQLKEEMYALADKALQSLQKNAQQLAEKQKSTQQLTAKAQASSNNADVLLAQQQSINQASQDLLAQMTQTASLLQDNAKQVSETLRDISKSAQTAGLQKSGKRANNALLYEVFSRATIEQASIEKQFRSMSNKLTDAQNDLSNASKRQLNKLLQRMAQMQNSLQALSDQQLHQSNQSLAKDLSRLSQAKSDIRLKNNIEQLESLSQENRGKDMRFDTSKILQGTERLLQSYLMDKQQQALNSRKRQGYQAPAKYKKQVEDYFKRLTESLQ